MFQDKKEEDMKYWIAYRIWRAAIPDLSQKIDTKVETNQDGIVINCQQDAKYVYFVCETFRDTTHYIPLQPTVIQKYKRHMTHVLNTLLGIEFQDACFGLWVLE